LPLNLGLSFLCFFFLPGLALSRLLPLGRKRDLWEGILLSLLLSLLLFSVLSLVAIAFGAGLGVLEIAYLTCSLGLGGAALLLSGRPDERQAHLAGPKAVNISVALLLVLMGVLLSLSRGGIEPELDSLDHLAFIREITLSGDIQPASVFYPGPDGIGTDPRKGLMHTLEALTAWRAGVDPVRMWELFPIIGGPLVALAFFLLSRELLGATAAAVVSLAVFFVFYPGENHSWFNGTAMAGRFSMGMVWLGLAAYVRYLREASRENLGIALGCGFVLLAFHLADFSLFVGGSAALAIAFSMRPEMGTVSRPGAWLAVLLIPVAASPVLLWRLSSNGPAVNPVHTHLHGILYLTDRLYLSGMGEFLEWLGRAGIVSIGVSFFLPCLSWRRDGAYFLLALTVCPLLVAANPILVPLLQPRLGYLVFRTVRIIPFPTVLAMFLTLILLRVGRGALRKRVLAAGGVLALAFLLAYQPVDFFGAQAEACRRSGTTGFAWKQGLAFLKGMPGTYVVASDPVTSYSIAGLTRHKVVSVLDQHGPPNDPRGMERLIAQRRMMSPYVSLRETLRLMREYGVNLVFLNHTFTRPEILFQYAVVPSLFAYETLKFDRLPEVFRLLWSGEGQRIYEVVGSLPAGAGDIPPLRPLPASVPEGRRAEVATGGLFLFSHRFGEKRVERGDTLHLRVDWKKAGPGGSDLPYRLFVRFDRAYPRSSWWRQGYSKIYRKVLESRSGARYRFRADLIPGHGAFPVQDWPAEAAIQDGFAIPVPRDLHPGKYAVKMKVVQVPLLLNLELTDWLNDQDYFEGALVDSLEIIQGS